MAWLPSLEYSVGHPLPKNRLFLLATLLIFLPIFPILLLLNIATLGSELVPSLQSQFQPNDTLLQGWLGTRFLPLRWRPNAPLCEPKELGDGQTIQLEASLFDYTILGVWNMTGDISDIGLQEQTRAEYRGQSFSHCYTNRIRWEYNLVQRVHIVTVGLSCPGHADYPFSIWMETAVVLSSELDKDFVGRAYGYSNVSNHAQANPSYYRDLVLESIGLMRADCIHIVRPWRHSRTPGLGMVSLFTIDPDTDTLVPEQHRFTYTNGTMAENWPLDINIYGDSILNLVHVINHAVNLDIGNPRFPNVFRDPSLLKDVIVPNPAPVGISLDQWVGNDNKTLYYGSIPSGYGTWAEALLDGKPFTLRNVTGLPPNPVMDTTYQCPMYRAKSISSLLTSVFVGTATMVTSAWAAWMFFAAFLAKRMAAPRVQCHCNQCEKRREKERRDEEANVGSFSQAELLLRLAALEELVKLPFNVEDQKKFDPGLANTPTGDQRNPLDVTDLSYNSRSTTGEH